MPIGNSRATAVTTLLIAVTLAGCNSPIPQPPQIADLGAPPEYTDETGALEGVVVDDSLVPLDDAEVAIPELSLIIQTGEDGRFSFSYLPPGDVEVVAAKKGHAGEIERVRIERGLIARLQIELVPLAAASAYHVTLIGQGRLNCGAAAWSPYTNGTLHNGSWAFPPCPVSPTGQIGDTSVVKFPPTAEPVAKIDAVMFETKWQSNQLLADDLAVYWYRTFQAAYTAPKLAFAGGSSPLKATLNGTVLRGHIEKNLPADPGCPLDGPCKFQAYTFAYASKAPLDVTFAFDQSFTHHVTQFYGLPPPEGFSSFPDR